MHCCREQLWTTPSIRVVSLACPKDVGLIQIHVVAKETLHRSSPKILILKNKKKIWLLQTTNTHIYYCETETNPKLMATKKFLNIKEFVHERVEAQISPGSRQDYAVPHNWHKEKKMGWRASYSHFPSQQCLSRLTRACKPLLFHDGMDALQCITTGRFK